MATGKGNTFISGLLGLIFQNIACANIGNTAGLQPSGVAGSLYLSLHTADPGAGGAQNTSEAGYGGYTRMPVARSSAGWTISGQAASLTSAVTFPTGTGGGEVCTYVGIGTASSGGGTLLYRATLTPAITTGLGIPPVVNTGNGVVEA